MSNRALMIDVSSNNPTPRIRLYKKAGHQVIALKATEGQSYTWDRHGKLSDRAHKHGLAVWHYHFARSGDPVAQARYFLAEVHGHWRDGDRLVLDAESTGVGAAFVQAFINACHERFPHRPGLVYSYGSFLTGAKIRPAHGWGLWLAAYGPIQPKPVAGWDHLTAWQFTDKATGVGGEPGAVDESHLLDKTVIPARPKHKKEPPVKVKRYSKSILALVGAVGTWATAALADGVVTGQEWTALGVATLTALGVYTVPNQQKKS